MELECSLTGTKLGHFWTQPRGSSNRLSLPDKITVLGPVGIPRSSTPHHPSLLTQEGASQ